MGLFHFWYINLRLDIIVLSIQGPQLYASWRTVERVDGASASTATVESKPLPGKAIVRCAASVHHGSKYFFLATGRLPIKPSKAITFQCLTKKHHTKKFRPWRSYAFPHVFLCSPVRLGFLFKASKHPDPEQYLELSYHLVQSVINTILFLKNISDQAFLDFELQVKDFAILDLNI